MAMVKKSISVTQHQDSWIKSQIDNGHYGNESEVVRELIRERQMAEQENSIEIAAIRSALVKGEQSGTTSMTVEEILQKVMEIKGSNEEL